MISPISFSHRAHVKATRHSESWQTWPSPGPRLAISLSRDVRSREFHRLQLEVSSGCKQISNPGSIVFLSDLHWNGQMLPLYEQLAREINDLEADWILFGGDLGVFTDTVAGALQWLSTLKSKQGKLAVLGNRESPAFWLKDEDWRRLFAQAGYHFLRNQAFDAGSLLFYGVDDYRFGHADWSPLQDDSRPVIAFSHNPDAAATASDQTFIGDIVLCGHTHGGQLCLPLYGPLYTSSEFGRQFVHGLLQRNDGTLCLVASGIGESGFGLLHHRLCCPREYVHLIMTP